MQKQTNFSLIIEIFPKNNKKRYLLLAIIKNLITKIEVYRFAIKKTNNPMVTIFKEELSHPEYKCIK
jgi:hypothetical protein